MKKILSLLMVLCIILSTMPTFAANAEDEMLKGTFLQFSDDFSNGNAFWKFKSGSTIKGGKIVTPKNWAYVTLNADGITWKDYILQFDFKLTDDANPETKDPWFMFSCKGMAMFWRIKSSLHGTMNGVEAKISDSKLQIGIQYTVRVIAKDNYIIVYLKKDGENSFTEVGNVKSSAFKAGGISFTSYYPSEIDNVKVYAYEDSDLVVKEKIKLMPIKGEYTPEIKNKNNAKLTYESANAEVASVNENGTVKGEKNGMTVINVKDENGQLVENVGIKVYTPIDSIDFDCKEKTMYVGDTIGLAVEVAPSNALAWFNWIMDKESIAEFYGTSDRRRSFIAKSPGEVTVTVSDKNSEKKATTKIIILPDSERPKDKTGTTVFSATGTKNAITDEFFGMHIGLGSLQEENIPATTEKLKEINTTSYRPEQSGFKIDKNLPKEERLDEWKKKMDPVLEVNKLTGNKLTYVLNARLYDDEILLEQVKYIYEKLGCAFKAELGNETYSIAEAGRFPSATDYFEWATNITPKIKQISPEIEVAAVVYAVDGEVRVLSDPNNKVLLKDDMAYTQPHRIDEWGSTAAKYADKFDAFISHDYAGDYVNTPYTADEALRMLYGYAYCDYYSILATSGRIAGKPLWITEWGNLPSNMFWGVGVNPEDKIRMQWSFYPGAAINNMEQFLNFAKSGVVTNTQYHNLQDHQGFGVYAPNMEETPNHMVFMKCGELLSECNTSYDLVGNGGGSYSIRKPFYWGTEVDTVINNVEGWGLGDETGIKKVVLSNHTNVTQTAKVSGAQIKPEWSYGGDIDKVFPDWMINRNYTEWAANKNIDTSLKPDLHTGATFADSIEIPPYTIVVCEVNGNVEIGDVNNADKTSKVAEFFMKRAVVLKVGANYGYVNNFKKPVDENDASVMPVIKDARTLLPLRFVSENFGCTVDYDDATKAIKIFGDGIEINLTVGDKKYTVNGEEKEFDVEAMVENGRTLVPLRALAEALGKDVLWDNSGLIVISYKQANFKAWQHDFENEYEQGELEKVLNLFN